MTNWSKLYSTLRKELPRFRGNSHLLANIIHEYAKNCGIPNLNNNQIAFLISKFTIVDFRK